MALGSLPLRRGNRHRGAFCDPDDNELEDDALRVSLSDGGKDGPMNFSDVQWSRETRESKR